ncbi:AI-2E family transporter [Gemmatimonas groenlandica]|uniref:AI-2E family transporter n=1 Tax=Gemmatimonas groenlandica TaxID=2732249 RepID=A0A6M4IUI5_9BACT|nr:AI-2E family transporter [Gemmatimonas groenlandica]QJR37798.1 AI-2E family transporter [Gemmatimonas groenlandica]
MTTVDQDLLPEPLSPERRGWRTADLARASVVALAVWFGLQLAWSVSSLLFLVFLATLFGLAVGRGVDYLERFRIRRGIASALIVLGTIGAIGGVLAWTAPTLIEQGKQLQSDFPEAVHKLQTWIDSKRTGLVGTIIKSAATPPPNAGAPTVVVPVTVMPNASTRKPTAAQVLRQEADSIAASPSEAIKKRITDGLGGASRYLFSFVSNTLAAVAAFFLLVFLAMYIGAEPEVYRGWLLAVVPATSRAQVRLVLAEIATVLRKWLVTQMIAMVVIGVVSMIVLLLLGVKAPFALAFIAGLFEFIPTVGPVLSAVPAVLMAFVDSPEKALAVLIAYWGIQFLENNLLIPYLMRGEMDLPPAITLVAQSLMTLVFGFVGLMVAVPLTAAVLVPLRMMAERENAREKAMVRHGKMQKELAHADVDPDTVMDVADSGPVTGATI